MTETRFPTGISGKKNDDLDISSDADIALYPQGNIWISQGTKLIFEGTTPDDWEVKLQATTVTADRDIILPDANGTVAVSVSDTTTTTQGQLNLDFTLSSTGNISATGSVFGLAVSDSPTFLGLNINGSSIVFEGSSADANETTLTVTDPTADNTITLPNASGTVALLSSLSVGAEGTASGDGAIAYNNTTGVFTYTPPTPAGIGATTLTSFSVGAEGTASGDGAIAYNNTTGVFTYTPPDLSTFLTSTVSVVLKIDDGIHEKFQTKVDATGAVDHDCSLGQIFYHTSPDANWTANLTNLNLSVGYATNISIIIDQGATGYYPNILQISGVSQIINWQGNTTPTVSTNRTDVVSFSIINTISGYVVLGQLSGF
jgi:hypothetical protein